MKILLIINRLEDQGGAEVSTIGLLNSLQGSFADFTVVTLYGSADFESLPALESRGARFMAAPQQPLRRLRFVSQIAGRDRPDVIHSTLFDSDLLARAVGPVRRIPVLSSLVNTEYSAEATAAARSPRKLEAARWINASSGRAGVSHFHAITAAVAEHARIRMRIPSQMISVVPRARDLDALGNRGQERRTRVRERLGVAESTPLILSVGRQELQKGQHHLLAAMQQVTSRYPDATLLIAGRVGHQTGALVTQLKNSDLGDRVRFLGQRDDVADLAAACDVFAFPSLWEGLGGSLIEAMAVQAPIVGFDIPTCREVVGDLGDLVSVGDSDALAKGILRALDDPERAAERAVLGRERVRSNYSMAQMADGMSELYERTKAIGPPPIWSS